MRFNDGTVKAAPSRQLSRRATAQATARERRRAASCSAAAKRARGKYTLPRANRTRRRQDFAGTGRATATRPLQQVRAHKEQKVSG